MSVMACATCKAQQHDWCMATRHWSSRGGQALQHSRCTRFARSTSCWTGHIEAIAERRAGTPPADPQSTCMSGEPLKWRAGYGVSMMSLGDQPATPGGTLCACTETIYEGQPANLCAADS